MALNQNEEILAAEFEKNFKVKYLPTLDLNDKGAQAWLKKAMAKKKRNELFTLNSRWTRAMFESEFKSRTRPPLELKKVSSLVGLGIYATEPLKRFTYIGEYTGIVRPFDKKNDSENDYIYRYIDTRYRSPYVIDAEHWGNFCRFINHSDEPNLLSRPLVIDGEYHVVFYTVRAIEAGEQLTYDYGRSYWKRRAAPLIL